MPKDYNQWLLELQKGIPPIMAIGGSEHALIEEALETIRFHTLQTSSQAFNHDRLSYKSKTLYTAINIANTLPWIAHQRLVEIHDVGASLSEEIDLLANYLSSPSPTSVMIFLYDALDMRHKWAQLFEEKGCLFCFSRLNPKQMIHQITKRAQKLGLTFPQGVADTLLQWTGADLALADRALEKLALAAPHKEISMHDIALHIANTAMEDVFRLCRALVLGEKKKALSSLLHLKLNRENPLRLVGVLSWQMRQVLKACLLLQGGKNPDQIAQMLSLYGENKRTTLLAAKQHTQHTHLQRLLEMGALDQKLKSGTTAGWLHLEHMVMKLCSLPLGQ